MQATAGDSGGRHKQSRCRVGKGAFSAFRGRRATVGVVELAKNHLELDSAAPMTAWAAARRAVGTRNGEHET
jgi:hypothetical protein